MPENQEADLLFQQQELFTRIAGKYDLINHLMTGWQDIRWRRHAINKLGLTPGAHLLDIGSGNGQIVREVSRQHPDCLPVAADLTQAMLEVGRLRNAGTPALWARADSAFLPFGKDCFDAVISAFLVRNLGDLRKGLREQHRVLKPGGAIVVLDTSKPPRHALRPLIHWYMNTVIPALGGLLTGHKEAYTYLHDSTEGFLDAEELAACLESAGFRDVDYRQFSLGLIAVHWGQK